MTRAKSINSEVASDTEQSSGSDDNELLVDFPSQKDDSDKSSKTSSLGNLKKAIKKPVQAATKTAAKKICNLRESLTTSSHEYKKKSEEASALADNSSPPEPVPETDKKNNHEDLPEVPDQEEEEEEDLAWLQDLEKASSVHRHRRDFSHARASTNSSLEDTTASRRVSSTTSRGVYRRSSRPSRTCRSASRSPKKENVEVDPRPLFRRQRSSSFSGGRRTHINQDDSEPSFRHDGSNSAVAGESRKTKGKKKISRRSVSFGNFSGMQGPGLHRSNSFSGNGNAQGPLEEEASDAHRSGRSNSLEFRRTHSDNQVNENSDKAGVDDVSTRMEDCSPKARNNKRESRTQKTMRCSTTPKRPSRSSRTPPPATVPLTASPDTEGLEKKQEQVHHTCKPKPSTEETMQDSSSKKVKETKERRSLTKFKDGITKFAVNAEATKVCNSSWHCTGCGERNMSMHHCFCGMCGLAKQEQPGWWECRVCDTKDNNDCYKFCGGCGSARIHTDMKPRFPATA